MKTDAPEEMRTADEAGAPTPVVVQVRPHAAGGARNHENGTGGGGREAFGVRGARSRFGSGQVQKRRQAAALQTLGAVGAGHHLLVSRRGALKLLGAAGAVLAAPGWLGAAPRDQPRPRLAAYPWLNQTTGPRPPFVWENMEDLIYHDLEYGEPALDGAPEFCAFMRRVWVFNRAMRWRAEGADGAIVCYSAAADLELTGQRQVSAWHSDPENEIAALDTATQFVKRSPLRRRDCAVLPAFQFHLGQHPVLEVTVTEASDDWQFVVSIKGRSGPPLLSSGWRQGSGEWRADLAAALQQRGYENHFAELHFVMGLWGREAAAEAAVTFQARLRGQAAVIGSLPVIRCLERVAASGAPVCAVVVNEKGELLGANAVRVQAEVAGQRLELSEADRFWKALARGLAPGNYVVKLTTEGAVQSATTVQLRITDGQFDRYDPARHLILREGKPLGPLSGSYQGTFFFRDVGLLGAPPPGKRAKSLSPTEGETPSSLSPIGGEGHGEGAITTRMDENPPRTRTSTKNEERGTARTPQLNPPERMVNGQAAWDAWDRLRPPGEHQHYWEALTPRELEERFAHLRQCGWDLLHLHQHWGIWERLDAGGRIAPHGAEQLALYLRTADRHGLKLIQALSSYEYSLQRAAHTGGGTAPFSRYVEAGFKDSDFFEPDERAFDRLFREYLKNFASLFRDETALLAMSASGEGDAFIRLPRAKDIWQTVRALDRNHLFVSEPIHILNKLPHEYTAGWPQDLCGARTYVIGSQLLPEFDLGVEFKFYQLGRIYLAEGSFAAAPHYVRFRQALEGGGGPESWTGTVRYRTRLRDTLHLGLVHRLPLLMTWDEQVAEDEHRIWREARAQVDWSQAWLLAPVAIQVDNSCVRGEGRARLADYEAALAGLALGSRYVLAAEPPPSDALAVIDARQPFQTPRFHSEGGTLPEELRELVPVRMSAGYCVSWCWSADRRTLLAYVYNVTNHQDLEGGADLSQRLHRLPTPTRLRLQLQHLPPAQLGYRLYDLNRKRVAKEGSVRREASFNLGKTDRDYLLVVTPR